MSEPKSKADELIFCACLLLFVALCLINATTYEFPYVQTDEHAHISYALHLSSYGALFPKLDDMYLYDFTANGWSGITNFINHPPFGYHLLNGLSFFLEVGKELRIASIFIYSLGMSAVLMAFYRYKYLPTFPLLIAAFFPFFLSVPQFASVFSNDSFAFLGGSMVLYGTLKLNATETIERGITILFAGVALTMIAKLNAALLVGGYAFIVIALSLKTNRHLIEHFMRPLTLLLVGACIIAALPYIYFVFAYGSPAPNSLAQMNMLKAGGNMQSIMSLEEFVFTSFIEAPKNAGSNLISMASYWLYFASIIISILYIIFVRKVSGPHSQQQRHMAIAAAVGTVLTMTVHLGFSYERHVAYGWQVEFYPRYYFPLMGVYLFLIAIGLDRVFKFKKFQRIDKGM